ncbi:LysR family transcriptional regulator ArgP [Pseudarthrobacter cellobiosi]|uniref:LysR family transcriptional regulator ArgP n=1 Tax=Pseudarthrobacter cellobiosi TaxID=2953654 RepID=UPI00208DF5D4|nr:MULTISPECIES: LysR family transcriptional regulator ArgP [unclassified Pseudarthrobacter]MCO4256219.1 LysR family transcriptional regulator ArgP [Pseudarthrobacter sp. HLT1-5]MCO4275773.1 LysR family transcriptional regulator ArgP [Pseudarthrobacter sp. HLT3-5]
MLTFQFEQLRTFAAVVDEGTLEAAARSLYVTPSAISQRLKAMEDAAGQILLQRTNPVRPTTAGEAILRFARQVRQLEWDAQQELGESRDRPTAPIPLVVNADSLSTWFMPALASLPPDLGACFELRREDEQHSTQLLRTGSVMAAVTATPEPVQGCSVEPLGSLRYRAVASPTYLHRWWPDGPELVAGSQAPVVDFDRKDDLQDGFFRTVTGAELTAPRHYVPSSAEFAQAIRLGLGWGLLPEQQCLPDLRSGALVELAPGSPVDVSLYWQRWKVDSPVLNQLTAAVRETASRQLRQPGA